MTFSLLVAILPHVQDYIIAVALLTLLSPTGTDALSKESRQRGIDCTRAAIHRLSTAGDSLGLIVSGNRLRVVEGQTMAERQTSCKVPGSSGALSHEEANDLVDAIIASRSIFWHGLILPFIPTSASLHSTRSPHCALPLCLSSDLLHLLISPRPVPPSPKEMSVPSLLCHQVATKPTPSMPRGVREVTPFVAPWRQISTTPPGPVSLFVAQCEVDQGTLTLAHSLFCPLYPTGPHCTWWMSQTANHTA